LQSYATLGETRSTGCSASGWNRSVTLATPLPGACFATNWATRPFLGR
jgi:hypothetical protein